MRDSLSLSLRIISPPYSFMMKWSAQYGGKVLIAFAVTVWAWPPSVSVWLWASVATVCPCVGSETPWACSLEPTACAWPGSETPWAWPQLLPAAVDVA